MCKCCLTKYIFDTLLKKKVRSSGIKNQMQNISNFLIWRDIILFVKHNLEHYKLDRKFEFTINMSIIWIPAIKSTMIFLHLILKNNTWKRLIWLTRHGDCMYFASIFELHCEIGIKFNYSSIFLGDHDLCLHCIVNPNPGK